VSATNGNGGPDDRNIPPAEVAAAERFARVIVFTMEVCDEGRVPLSPAQKVALIEAALLEFDGLGAELSSLAGLSALLRGLHPDDRAN
jgi:hypothetical protein